LQYLVAGGTKSLEKNHFHVSAFNKSNPSH